MTRAWVLMMIATAPHELPATRWFLDAATCRVALVDAIAAHVLRDAWCQEVQLRPMRPVTMEGVQ